MQESAEEKAELRISRMLAETKGNRWTLDRLGRLAAIGDAIGASPVLSATAMSAYLQSPEDWNFGLQQKTLICRAYGLPEEALNSPLTVGELLDSLGERDYVRKAKAELGVHRPSSHSDSDST